MRKNVCQQKHHFALNVCVSRRVVSDGVQLKWTWWADLSFLPCYQREPIKRGCLISRGLLIREEPSVDMDQWSSGSRQARKQKTFKHTRLLRAHTRQLRQKKSSINEKSQRNRNVSDQFSKIIHIYWCGGKKRIRPNKKTDATNSQQHTKSTQIHTLSSTENVLSIMFGLFYGIERNLQSSPAGS